MNDNHPHAPEAAVQPNRITIFFALSLFILLLLVGSVYFWQRSQSEATASLESTRPTREQNNEPESTTADAQTDALLVTSTSNETLAIEADIVSTDLTNLHSEFIAIEAEFAASDR
ncbi:hypothetical protein K2Q16_03840 [Patescibacteria group bacterium]|nr:hypothetical protein [Patescibacteria group bacterium]